VTTLEEARADLFRAVKGRADCHSTVVLCGSIRAVLAATEQTITLREELDKLKEERVCECGVDYWIDTPYLDEVPMPFCPHCGGQVNK